MKASGALAMLPFLYASQALAADDLSPFPPPSDGYQRMIVKLPPVTDEADRKVEIIVGKEHVVDCNATWFTGDLVADIVKGWGLKYFSVKKINGPAATMMKCADDDQKKIAFVQLRGDGFLQDYISSSLMVIYVPKEFQVRFRIWTAGRDFGYAREQ